MAALPQEMQILRRILGADPGASGERVSLAVSGVGAQRARHAAGGLIGSGAAALVSWGTAAGLRPGLAPGTLLLPEIIIDRDGRRLDADPRWHQALVAEIAAHAYRLSTAPLAEASWLLGTAQEKAALLRDTGAVAADMESAAIAEAAREAGVPFVAVRAVADPAHGVIPSCVSRAMDEEGKVHIPRLLAGALAAPAQWGHLVRLAWWFRAAERGLSRAARYIVMDAT